MNLRILDAATVAVSAVLLVKPPAFCGATEFQTTVANKNSPPAKTPEGMVWIPGGEFSMGAAVAGEGSHAMPMASNDSQPVHRVYVDGFWMDTTPVTNAQFEKFVKATGYVTIAERTPTKEEFPTAPEENLVAGSVVFAPTDHEVSLNNHYQWWSYVKGANWRHPFGPGSDIKGRESYPVVQIAYPDAEAYAKWAGKRLPTEAEFEFAARGGLSGKTYVWGDEFRPGGKWMANTWQGKFPVKDAGEDSYADIAPVKSFPPNNYGLYDMAGNVWEWVYDWYDPRYYTTAGARNPTGPPVGHLRIVRGGSWLVADVRMLSCSHRHKVPPDTYSYAIGFRVACSL